MNILGDGIDAARDRALGGFVGLVTLAGSLSALQTFGVLTPDGAVVLSGILVLAAVALSLRWRTAAWGISTSAAPSAVATGCTAAADDPDLSGGAAEFETALQELSDGLAILASGDLTVRIAGAFPAGYERLRGHFNEVAERISGSTKVSTPSTVSARAPDETGPPACVDMTDLVPRIVVAKPLSSRKAAKVDLFAGRMSELIALRDAGALARRPNPN